MYAYEAKIQPPPAPLLPPEELPDQGLYDPFNSSAPHTDTENPPQSQKYSAAFEPIDFSTVTDWSPVRLIQSYFRAYLTRDWFARRSTLHH